MIGTARITHLARRGFLKAMAGAAAALVLVKSRIAHAKKLAISLDKVPELKKVGGTTTIDVSGQPVIFVRDSEKSVRAFNPICTHKKCKVNYKEELGHFKCKCHKSEYSMEGKVLGGPAPDDLTRFRTKLTSDRVLIEIPD